MINPQVPLTQIFLETDVILHDKQSKDKGDYSFQNGKQQSKIKVTHNCPIPLWENALRNIIHDFFLPCFSADRHKPCIVDLEIHTTKCIT
jgi:hypothetical protein